MTAEIAILNKSAVALAADSTVTVGGSNDPRKVKTYQSANKLFTLSKHHPIGAMVYGNAGLMDVPWETLIKQYRQGLGTKCLATVSDYVADFIRYLERSAAIFTDELQRSFLAYSVRSYFVGFWKEIVIALENGILNTRDATATEVGDAVGKMIAARWHELDSTVAISRNLTKRFEDELIRTHKQEIDTAISAVFKFPISVAAKGNLHRIAGRFICGEFFPRAVLSGVVLAGFGNDQIFPEVQTFSPHLIASGKLVYRLEPEESYTITHNDPAGLIPFAQTDVVDSFLNGIDIRYLSIVENVMRELSTNYPEIVVRHLGICEPEKSAEILEKIKAETKLLADKLTDRLKHHRATEHVHPLLAVIGTLPKNELAELAEALVNLTSLKRKVSSDLETVGGPIDVAVISKGDGFIWIRRKHYFKPELNPHYLGNYLRESGHAKRKNEP